MSYNAQGIYKKNNIEKFSETPNCECKGSTCGSDNKDWCYLKDNGKNCKKRSDWIKDGNFNLIQSTNTPQKWAYCSYFQDHDKTINNMSQDRRFKFLGSEQNIMEGGDKYIAIANKYKQNFPNEKEINNINTNINRASAYKNDFNPCFNEDKSLNERANACHRLLNNNLLSEKDKYSGKEMYKDLLIKKVLENFPNTDTHNKLF